MFFSALKSFLSRYITVWRNVWAVRDQLEPPKRTAEEQAFLPAHLELTDTPVSAAPKWAARFIMAFALLALLWSWFGKIDIVAAASGKTVSGGRSKTIQPLETVVVKAVHVRDGQHVKQGETLAELEAVGTDSDVVQSEQALQAAQLSKLRYEAVLAALESRTVPHIDMAQARSLGLSDADVQSAQVLAQHQYQHGRRRMRNCSRLCAAIRRNCSRPRRRSRSWFRWGRSSSRKQQTTAVCGPTILFRNMRFWSSRANRSAIGTIWKVRAVR